MHIELTNEQFFSLDAKATAAGFDGAAAFVRALAEEPTDDPRGPLSEQQIAESVARLRKADEAIDAGKGINAHEAMQRIADKHGFTIS